MFISTNFTWAIIAASFTAAVAPRTMLKQYGVCWFLINTYVKKSIKLTSCWVYLKEILFIFQGIAL